MKKNVIYLCFVWILAWIFISCSEDDKYIPTPPEVSIVNVTGKNSCLPGDIIKLKVKLSSPLAATFYWSVNDQEVSKDSTYEFSSAETGIFKVALTATNADGSDTDTLSIDVHNKTGFRFADILNWTGQGENYSALTIQWVSGDDLLNPADDEVFYRAWGYRWEKSAGVTGTDMLKAVAKNDSRLYLILAEQWGGITVKGFGYDGNNDGKIKIGNSTLQLTQEDFVDGIYWQKESDDIDGMKPADGSDYWMGGWMQAYASYWVGDGKIVPQTDQFDYSQVAASGRRLDHESWDAWTFSPFNSAMENISPISRLLKPADPDK